MCVCIQRASTQRCCCRDSVRVSYERPRYPCAHSLLPSSPASGHTATCHRGGWSRGAVRWVRVRCTAGSLRASWGVLGLGNSALRSFVRHGQLLLQRAHLPRQHARLPTPLPTHRVRQGLPPPWEKGGSVGHRTRTHLGVHVSRVASWRDVAAVVRGERRVDTGGRSSVDRLRCATCGARGASSW